MPEDEFEGESGLRANYNGEIIDSWWAIAPNAGQTLHMYWKVRDLDTSEEDEIRYGAGPDWGSFDGGLTVEHPKDTGDALKKFNHNVRYQKMITRVWETDAKDELIRRSREQFNSQGPRHAALWKGLRFHFAEVNETITVPDDNDKSKRVNRDVTWVCPDTFLGVGEVVNNENVTGATNPAPIPATTTPTIPTETTEMDGDGIDPTLKAKMKILATQHPYSGWVDEVMTLPGVVEDANILSVLGSEDFYNSLRG